MFLIIIIINNYIEAVGYAPVAIIRRQDSESLKDSSAEIENIFASSLREGAGASLSLNDKDQTYRYYPHLGIYYGYIDAKGLNDMKNIEEASIHLPQIPSLIRPVGIRPAMPSRELTWGLEKLGVKGLWDQGITGKGVKC